ncbi:hypothetical protein ABEX55_16050 [Priestia endophytica]|uniref:hypothetical protein n=1 Tax=Priestia endophytica TaxID=135735 RepID=UPI003D2952E1
MKLDPTLLPRKDRKYYEDIKRLSISKKKMLWYLIQKMDKNHVVVLPRLNSLMKSLLDKQLVISNPLYKRARGKSFFIMPDAPYLIRKLRRLHVLNKRT